MKKFKSVFLFLVIMSAICGLFYLIWINPVTRLIFLMTAFLQIAWVVWLMCLEITGENQDK
jgi:hypothetical protein